MHVFAFISIERETLLHSTVPPLAFTLLYYNQPWLLVYLALHVSNVALLDSSILNHGSTMALLGSISLYNGST